MNRAPSFRTGPAPFEAFLGDLEQLGVQRVTSGGHEYVVIGARTNARWWLLPLGERQATAAGLEMFQPLNWRATLKKGIARGAAQIGLGRALGRRQLRLSGPPDLRQAFRGRAWSYAYFTGTDGPHRKTAIQVMGREGEILGYAKLSRLQTVRRYIAAEAAMLNQVNALDLGTADVPRKLTYTDDGDVTLLVTDSLKTKRSTAPKRLASQHLAFLNELAQRTARIGADDTLERLTFDVELLRPHISAEWRRRFASGISQLRERCAKLPVGLAHGDFTPWNAFLQDSSLYVFDWEYANASYPVGYDLIHFILSGTTHSSAPLLAEQLVSHLRKTQYLQNQKHAPSALLLALLIHAAFYLRRSIDAGDERPSFGRQTQRATLIDALIECRSAI